MERTNTLGWRPALEGLRGVAVVCVVLFHFNTKALLPGGSLGVDLFFALSGFLITSMLVEEWLAAGSIRLRRFYLRRTLRLLPALVAFVLVVATIQIVFRDAAFTKEPPVGTTLVNAALGLSYFYNWPIALDSVNAPQFSHLWTLSIEEQFYLLWPAMLIVMLKLGLSVKQVLFATATLALISASVPLAAGHDWHRLYFGTDYRMHGLLIGSMAGTAFASGLIRREHLQSRAAYAGTAIAMLYLAMLMLFATDKAGYLYVWGYPAIALSSSLIVLSCAFVDRGLPMLALGNGVITYIGRRSYAIYLWHVPIGIWLRDLDAPVQLVVAGAFTLLAAELSHRLVERPALSLRRRLSADDGLRFEPVPVPLLDEPALQTAA